jgi:hypothetical protein
MQYVLDASELDVSGDISGTYPAGRFPVTLRVTVYGDIGD